MLEWISVLVGRAGFGEVGLFERWVVGGGVLTGAMVLGLGLGVGYVLGARGEGKKGAIAAVVGVLVGVAVGAASFIETDRELIERRSGALVEVFFAGDVDGVERMLSERLVVSAGGESEAAIGWAYVVGRVREYGDEFARDWGSGVKASGMDGARTGRVRMRVREASFGFAVVDLTWSEEEEDVWRVVRVDFVSWNGQAVRGGMLRGWR